MTDTFNNFQVPGFFKAIVCSCPFQWFPSNSLDDLSKGQFKSEPDKCPKCGKFQNQLRFCPKCNRVFYQHFIHPRMGFRMKPKRGWWCWNCCEKYVPGIVMPEIRLKEKVPPPNSLIPPDYILYVRDRSGYEWLTT